MGHVSPSFSLVICRAGRRSFLNDRLEFRELGSLGGTSTERPPIDLRRQFGASGGSTPFRNDQTGRRA